jgi:hypothetical protein
MGLPDGGAVVRAQGVEEKIHDWGHRRTYVLRSPGLARRSGCLSAKCRPTIIPPSVAPARWVGRGVAVRSQLESHRQPDGG